jgi:hypothetical protein
MSNRRILGAVLLAASFGCSSDDSSVDDARELPEGGGFRVEFMEIGAPNARAIGQDPEGDRILFDDTELIFYKDQTPARRKWPPDIIDLGREIPDGTVCYKTDEVLAYWVSNVPEQQGVLDTRTYLDVGASVKLSGPSGFEMDLMGNDGGISPLQLLVHGRIYLPPQDQLVPDTAIPDGGWYEVVPEDLPSDLPEFAPTNGIAMWTGEPRERFGAYRPKYWTLDYPEETGYMMYGAAYNSNEDFVWRMNRPEQPEGAGPITKSLGAIKITETGIVIDTICFNAEPHGTLTVPKEIIQEFPQGGIVSLNFFNASVYEWDGRQFDATGFTCKANFFCTDDPGATDGHCSPPAAARMTERLKGLHLNPAMLRIPPIAPVQK